MSKTTVDRRELAASSLNVPPGVSGRHRELYLALTDAQKAVYRHHWFVLGRLAGHCYVKAEAGSYEW